MRLFIAVLLGLTSLAHPAGAQNNLWKGPFIYTCKSPAKIIYGDVNAVTMVDIKVSYGLYKNDPVKSVLNINFSWTADGNDYWSISTMCRERQDASTPERFFRCNHTDEGLHAVNIVNTSDATEVQQLCEEFKKTFAKKAKRTKQQDEQVSPIIYENADEYRVIAVKDFQPLTEMIQRVVTAAVAWRKSH